MERFMASLKRDAQGSQSQQQNISRAAADLASAGRKQHSQQRHDNFEVSCPSVEINESRSKQINNRQTFSSLSQGL
jgi:hypothetical protein